jgi:hypothetical protein
VPTKAQRDVFRRALHDAREDAGLSARSRSNASPPPHSASSPSWTRR